LLKLATRIRIDLKERRVDCDPARSSPPPRGVAAAEAAEQEREVGDYRNNVVSFPPAGCLDPRRCS
jgi:hypothetical protein